MIKVSSLDADNVTDQNKIEVISDRKMVSNKTRVVNFKGTPKKVIQNKQKIVDRYSKAEVSQSKTIPKSVKDVSANPKKAPRKT